MQLHPLGIYVLPELNVFRTFLNHSYFIDAGTGPDCGIPDSPENGYIILQATVPGSEVLYGCMDGFEIVGGSDTRTCGTNERWTGTVPTCRR